MRLVEGVADVDDVGAFVERLDAVGARHGVTVQAFDARYVVSRAHLERAVELAERAFERGANVAHDRGVEILLYAAGRRQIDRALTMGVSPGEQSVVVLVDAGDDDGAAEDEAAAAVERELRPASTLGAFDEGRVREYFDVGARELAVVDGRLADVVLERVALLDVEK
ncbi:KEOPS complex subunit Cgi121 [Salinigranum halophilum]|jgi:KEOPS complex subunit Cgi121|uniref:KEOPS complex subunit Cgi121 n=1 Tax=Salinigranum halophilum TaxID=2565931 RepID=UPI00115DD26E|nr:KEOPS complex subunit Cgi121 [Salinigranum halophilum]